jgi:DNA-binding protein HU-beta
MNKTDLINCLSEETAFPKSEVIKFLDSMIRILERNLKKGNKVQLAGFGTFSVTRRAPRVGINPSTKERIQLPASVIVRFRSGKHLKENVKSLR